VRNLVCSHLSISNRCVNEDLPYQPEPFRWPYGSFEPWLSYDIIDLHYEREYRLACRKLNIAIHETRHETISLYDMMILDDPIISPLAGQVRVLAVLFIYLFNRPLDRQSLVFL